MIVLDTNVLSAILKPELNGLAISPSSTMAFSTFSSEAF
jgi:hypothetical protein